MVAGTGIDYRRTAHTLAGAVVTGGCFKAKAGNKFRLWQQHIDRTTHGPGAVKHRSAALDHFNAFSKTQAHERCNGTGGLCGVEPHAIDQQHDAVFAEATNHRILALRTVIGNGNAGFAPQGITKVLSATTVEFRPIKNSS